MPNALLRVPIIVVISMLVSACATSPVSGPTPPDEIRSYRVEWAAQYVEASVPPEDVAEAVRALVAAEPVCTAWPALWLQEGGRRSDFIARFDLMARDWGAEVAASSRERMEEFVASGFFTRTERDDLGVGAVQYTITRAGDDARVGWPGTSQRPNFCAPSERRLVDVTSMEWGQFPCGNLKVRFSHVSDDWPSWARAQGTRDRLAQMWPALGEPAEGTVTLSRFWFSGRRNDGLGQGELASVCYDGNRIIGDDLELFAPAQ